MSPVADSSLAPLLEQFRSGDRRALARLITYVDDGGDAGPVISELGDGAGRAMKVAITGSAGVGKSTLIAGLVKHLRGLGKRVAVVACDPQSPRTGGALLGDRIRMDDDPADAGLYIRSLSTRGGSGGISDAVGPITRLVERFGFDVVLIETIGVGQDQVAASAVADLFVLVLTPGGGDEVQWQKAGIMECADVIVVNKADLNGAEMMAKSLKAMTGKPVAMTVAQNNRGTAELWGIVADKMKQR